MYNENGEDRKERYEYLLDTQATTYEDFIYWNETFAMRDWLCKECGIVDDEDCTFILENDTLFMNYFNGAPEKIIKQAEYFRDDMKKYSLYCQLFDLKYWNAKKPS